MSEKAIVGPVPDHDLVAENKYRRVDEEVVRLCEQIVEAHHPDLQHARIGLLFRSGTWKSKGRTRWGQAQKASGKIRALAGDIDFLVTLNEDVWFDELDNAQRRALLDHELCHCAFDVVELKASTRGHDVEEFAEIIRRHGVWDSSLRKAERAFEDARQMRLELDEDGQEERRGSVVAVDVDGEQPLREQMADEFERKGILAEEG